MNPTHSTALDEKISEILENLTFSELATDA